MNVLAIPTDTVYGLAAPLSDAGQLFTLKRRASGHPLPILAASLEQVTPFLEDPPPSFFALAKTYWPGALTLALPADCGKIPENVRAGRKTAAFRIPNHPIALQILRERGPLAVTSANRSGEPPATTAEEVRKIFGNQVEIIDGGTCAGAPSTVLAWERSRWKMVREGEIFRKNIFLLDQ